MPPAPTGINSAAQTSQVNNLPARYTYTVIALPCDGFFPPDVFAQNSQHDTDFDPDILTDEETSTG